MKKINSVEDYIAKSSQWADELSTLRTILASTELEETVKWGTPCYTYKSKNVVGMISFKPYFGLWFHQGATLKDTNNKLINAQEGKTKALRQWRMSNANEIKPSIIKRYVKESIANIDKGVEIKAVKARTVAIPNELKAALTQNSTLKAAFDKLTPGKQREYSEHINDASRAATKERRLEKIVPLIMAGSGLHDRYR